MNFRGATCALASIERGSWTYWASPISRKRPRSTSTNSGCIADSRLTRTRLTSCSIPSTRSLILVSFSTESPNNPLQQTSGAPMRRMPAAELCVRRGPARSRVGRDGHHGHHGRVASSAALCRALRRRGPSARMRSVTECSQFATTSRRNSERLRAPRRAFSRSDAYSASRSANDTLNARIRTATGSPLRSPGANRQPRTASMAA